MQAQSIAVIAECLDADLHAGPWAVDAATYHADTQTLSSGMIQDYLRCIPDYAARHEYRTAPRKKPTPEMQIGTALHYAVLEPVNFFDVVVNLPVDDFRTKAAQTQRNELQAAGKIVLKTEDYELVERMAAAMLAHGTAGPLLARAGPTEYAIRFQDEVTGLWCRALIDKPIFDAGLLLNLKTTAGGLDSWAFGKTAGDLGYHCSAAWYCDGAQQALGLDGVDEMFIVVSKETCEVACHWLHKEAVALGRSINRKALDEIAERRRTGDWSSRHDNCKPYTTNLPRFSYPTEQR
jgi:hypothetical protein